jgi:XRE family transcriptional regulator, regulator of sulfur utilization
MEIGATLRQIRRDKNLSQVTVCKRVKISQTYLSQIEKGEKEPSGEMFRKICSFYKVPHQIVVWKSLTEDDIPKNKKGIFKQLSPAINSLIDEALK